MGYNYTFYKLPPLYALYKWDFMQTKLKVHKCQPKKDSSETGWKMAGILKNPVVTGIRRLFILVSPNETSFEKIEHVPDYVDEVSKSF